MDSEFDDAPDAPPPMPDPRSDDGGADGAAPVRGVPTERLEKRVVAYWYSTDILRSLVMATLLVGGAWFWGQSDPQRPAWIQHLAIALGALLVTLSLVVPPLAYSRWRFSVDRELLAMRYGILFVEERIVPVPRMQHVDLMRGPIERLFGLATLVVFTAGNEGSAFRVPGLSRQRAEAIRDGILEARGHDFT